MLKLYLAISHDRMKIEGCNKHQSVRLVSALRMTCGMTPVVTSGSSRDADLRSNFKLTFRGQRGHHSMRLDERNTMVKTAFPYLDKFRCNRQKTKCPKNDLFVTSQVTGWPRTLKLGTNRFVSWRPTRSFLSRVASSIRGQTRGGGGCINPPYQSVLYKMPNQGEG